MDIDTTLELLGILIGLNYTCKNHYLTPMIEAWDILCIRKDSELNRCKRDLKDNLKNRKLFVSKSTKQEALKLENKINELEAQIKEKDEIKSMISKIMSGLNSISIGILRYLNINVRAFKTTADIVILYKLIETAQISKIDEKAFQLIDAKKDRLLANGEDYYYNFIDKNYDYITNNTLQLIDSNRFPEIHGLFYSYEGSLKWALGELTEYDENTRSYRHECDIRDIKRHLYYEETLQFLKHIKDTYGI